MFALRAVLGRFRPDYIPGLFAWYDATSGSVFSETSGGSAVTTDNGVIKRWEDVSGNGHHLTGTSVQIRLGLGGNGQNGLPVVRRGPHIGANDDGELSTNFGTGGITSGDADIVEPYTVIFAARIGYAGDSFGATTQPTTGSSVDHNGFVRLLAAGSGDIVEIGSRYPGNNAALTSNRFYVGNDAGLAGGSSTGSALPLNNQTFAVIAVLFNGANSRISINGGAWTQYSLASANIRSLVVLADPRSIDVAHNGGALGEMCIYNEVLADADREQVIGYLKDKWNVS